MTATDPESLLPLLAKYMVSTWNGMVDHRCLSIKRVFCCANEHLFDHQRRKKSKSHHLIFFIVIKHIID